MSIRRIPLNVERLPDKISLGRGSENEAVQLAVDVSAWVNAWPACSISINFLRPFEDIFYTVSGVLDGGLYTYEVTDTDTAIAGTGTMEFVCTEDGKLAASAVARFVVEERLLGTQSPTPPEPVQSWYTRALQAADDAEDAADRAETAAESIESIEPRVEALEDATYTNKQTAWNQLVQNGNFVSTDGWQKGATAHTLVAENNVITLTVTSTSAMSRIYRENFVCVTGHKYFAHAELKASAETYPLRMYVGGAVSIKSGTANEWTLIEDVLTAVADSATLALTYGDSSSHRLPSGGTLSARNVWLVDLTAIYGEGNEPTAEEFRQLFPHRYYAYAALGSVRNLDIIEVHGAQIAELQDDLAEANDAITANATAITALDATLVGLSARMDTAEESIELFVNTGITMQNGRLCVRVERS